MRIRTFVFAGLSAGIAIVLSACGSLDSGAPSYDTISAQQARLYFDAPAFSGATGEHRRADRRDSGYAVERAYWENRAGISAETMLIEALQPKGLQVPDDPQDEIANFVELVPLKVTFGKLYQSETAMGPAIWRRFVAGDRSCVIFSQRWDDGPGTPATRTLFGYNCAASGEVFTLQDAQAVLRHAGIRAK